jgi:chromosome segregation ATPase
MSCISQDSESRETNPSHSQVALDLHRPDSHANLISRLTQLDSNLTRSRSDYSHACLHSSQLEQLLFDSSTQTSHLSEQLSRSHDRFEELQYEFDRMRDAATRELQLAAEKVHTTQMECQRARDRIRELEEKAQRRETEMWTKETGRRTGGAFEGSSGASNVGSTRGMGRGRGGGGT